MPGPARPGSRRDRRSDSESPAGHESRRHSDSEWHQSREGVTVTAGDSESESAATVTVTGHGDRRP